MINSGEESVVVAEDTTAVNNAQKNNAHAKKKGGFSKIGFVLAAAGAAVGLGNIWRFPIQVQKFGGGAFVLMYLFFGVLLGVILLMLEISIGRKTGEGVIGAFRALCKKFWWLGIIAAIIPLLILSYYNVLGGWTLFYSIYYLTYGMGQGLGAFNPENQGGSEQIFNGLLQGGGGYVGIIFMLLFLGATAFIILMGVQKGIEKASKILMPVLVIFILFIMVYTLCQGKDAWKGVGNFFIPDFKKFFGLDKGSFKMDGVLAALTQVFYSMSIASASIITYGSYMQKKESITSAATQIAVFDIAIGVFAGLIVIPGLFILGGGVSAETSGGSALLFVQLPQLFYKTGGPIGSLIFGGIFYVLVFFAALTSAISLMEAAARAVSELFKITRKKAVLLLFVFFTIIGILISLGRAFEWKVLPVLNNGVFASMSLDDTIDWIANNFFICSVSLMTCICAAWCSDFERIEDEIGLKKKSVRTFYKIMIKYVAPILILVVMLWGIISSFVQF